MNRFEEIELEVPAGLMSIDDLRTEIDRTIDSFPRDDGLGQPVVSERGTAPGAAEVLIFSVLIPIGVNITADLLKPYVQRLVSELGKRIGARRRDG